MGVKKVNNHFKEIEMTLEEIQKAIKENPSLAKEVAVWTTAETDAGRELLTNHAKAQVDKAVKEKTAEIYTAIDGDLFEVLGVRKKTDQKTYDFVKGIAGEYKSLKEKADKLDGDETIKGLKAKIKEMQDGGDVNGHWKKVYDEAVAKWESEKTELSQKITAKEKEYFEAQVEADLRAGLTGLTFKDGVDQSIIDTIVEAKKKEFLAGAKIVDGKVIYHKEDGVPLLNKEYKPITPNEIWADKLGSLIKTSESAKGGGAKATLKDGKVVTTGEGDTATIKVVLDEGSFSTKVEFNNQVDKALRKQGVAVGSKSYKDAMLNAYKDYDVDKLELQ